jgi:hypothetical protein
MPLASLLLVISASPSLARPEAGKTKARRAATVRITRDILFIYLVSLDDLWLSYA